MDGAFIGLEDGRFKEPVWLLRECMSGKHIQGYFSYKEVVYYYLLFWSLF